jgi:hypothetical protein
MAILVHRRDLLSETPREAARSACAQAQLHGAAEALGLEVLIDLDESSRVMQLHASGPLPHVLDLCEQAEHAGVHTGIERIEVDSEEDEDIIRECLGEMIRIYRPEYRPHPESRPAREETAA